jgi:hypothetical protein
VTHAQPQLAHVAEKKIPASLLKTHYTENADEENQPKAFK